jgi:hypothetical protein
MCADVPAVRIFLVCCALAFPCTASSQHNIQVSAVKFAKKIVDREPVGEISLPFDWDGRSPLHVWFELIGTKQTLAYLERHGSLPLRAVWRIGIRNAERIDIGMTAERWAEDEPVIRDAVRREGLFKWRTSLNKTRFEADDYVLHVVDDSGNRIRDQQTNKAFEVEISIRRQ